MRIILINIFVIVNKLINLFYLKIFKVNYDNTIKINGKLFLRNKGVLIIKKNVIINSKYSANPIGGQTFTSLVVGKNGVLKIEDESGISNSAIVCMEKITIGKQVYIGGDCKIYDTDFHSVNRNDRMKRPEINKKTSPIIIKDGVFIGTGCIILKGVTIGENSVIGAGSVVTKNIPKFEVWGGNPVKFIKKIDK